MTVYKQDNIYRVDFRYYDRYGRRQRLFKGGFKTKKLAERYETKMKSELLEFGIIYGRQKITLNEVWKEYLELDERTAQSTKEMRSIYYDKHIRTQLGESYIELLDYAIMQRFFKDLSTKLSKASCENVYKVFNAIFKFSYNHQYISQMPYQSLVIRGKPGRKHNNQQTISYEQYIQLCEYLETSLQSKKPRTQSVLLAIKIGYYTGMRLSEILALDKDDVDFVRMQINIDKALTWLPRSKELKIKDPKSSASKAKIPLPLEIKEDLSVWIKMYPSKQLLCDNHYDYINPTSFKKSINNLSRHVGFHFNFHMLRHTYATTLWRNNVDVKIAQRLLRHKSYQTTMDVYTEIGNENLNSITDNLKR